MGKHEIMLAYSFTNQFERNEKKEFPPGTMSFPCFSEELFWVFLTETDDIYDEVSQVFLECN